MENEKNNPLDYKTEARMEEERQNAEKAESRSIEEQTVREHFEKGSWQEDAEKTVQDKDRMNDLVGKEGKFTNKKGLSRIREQLILLWDYVKAIMSGDYVDYSTWAFIKATAGLLYVVSPFDVVPDFFPWVGWADDVLVVMYVCNLLHTELEKFAAWQNRQQTTSQN